MPIVPRVSLAPLPGVRTGGGVPDAAFGGGAGNAAVGLNAGISAVRSTFHAEAERIAQDERDHADEVHITGAGAEVTAASTASLHGPDGALNKMGGAAFDTPETTRKAFFERVGQVRTRLTSDRQRDVFDHMVAQQWGEIDRQVQHHVATQRRAYDASTTDAAIAALQDKAIKGYADPDVVAKSIEAIKGNATLYGLRNGRSPEQIQAVVADYVSDVHTGVLSRMLDSEDDLAASKYFTAHRDQIAGVDQGPLEHRIGLASTLGEAQRLADQIVAGRYAPGLVQAGNIDLRSRPPVKNEDGSVSTVRSISIEEDGKTVLIPTVVSGRVVSDDAAVSQYRKSGEHLGIFNNEASANTYAQQLHAGQARLLAGGQQVSATEARAQAESIANPKLREKAIDLVMAHFTDLDRAQRIDREAARARVLQALRTSKGRLNEASADWQLINGHDEGKHVLDEQRQILHPPPDRGDPDKYAGFAAMSAISPETRRALRETNIQEINDDPTLSGGQKTAIMNMIRSEKRAHETELRRQILESQQEAKRLEQLVKKAQEDGDRGGVTSNTPFMLAAQHRTGLLRAQLLETTRGSPSQSGSPELGAAPAHQAGPSPFGLSPMKPLTPEMVQDIATYGEGYADHLRKSGYAVPAVLPKPQPTSPKK